jgi:hypothetical protein
MSIQTKKNVILARHASDLVPAITISRLNNIEDKLKNKTKNNEVVSCVD